MDNRKTVTEYEIKKLSLINSKNEEVNIIDFYEEISVYEDIFSNSIKCDIVFLDSVGFFESFPIIGEETLILQIDKGNEEIVNFEMYSYLVNNYSVIKEKVITYQVHFCSKELFKNLRTKISRSYKGIYSNIVKNIYNYYLKIDKDIEIEKSKFYKKIVVPNITPFSCINWLASLAIPFYKNRAGYLFYEDREGYKFISLETLLVQEKKQSYHLSFSDVLSSNKGGINPQEDIKDQFVIEKLHSNRIFNILDNSRSGMYANQLITHDIIGKKYTIHNYSLSENFDKKRNINLSKYPPFSDNNLFLNKYNCNIELMPTDYKYDETYNSEKYSFNRELSKQNRKSLLNEYLNGLSLEIKIPGDPERKIGDVIELFLHTFRPNEDNEFNSYFSGSYLVNSIKHVFNKKRGTYNLYMKISKNGFNQKIT